MKARAWIRALLGVVVAAQGACGEDANISLALAPEDVSVPVDTSSEAEVVQDVPVVDVPPDVPVDVPVEPGRDCTPCAQDAECAEDYRCVALLGGSFCAHTCQGTESCAVGYTCQVATQTTTDKLCIPTTYACDGCVALGCPSGQTCDATSGKCLTGKPACYPCSKESDCQTGMKCTSLSNNDSATQTLCLPTCGPANACPTGSQCVKSDAGPVCGFTGAACCIGAGCAADPVCATCSGNTAKCVMGGCVGCLLDGDCSQGHCDIISHSCVNPVGCPFDKPVKAPDGSCVICAQDSDCAGGQACDGGTHKCIGTPSACAKCTGSYADCAKIADAWTCVECSSDVTCQAKGKTTCAMATSTCQ